MNVEDPTGAVKILDGLSEIQGELPLVMRIIARTSRWVHPRTFKALPVWCPDTARGRPQYDVRWSRVLKNKHEFEKKEQNIRAAQALVLALGVSGRKPKNWSVCHIWGYDDDRFADKSEVVQNPRYYSCIGNMIWLPTPLKGFTDSVPLVKDCIRTCAFHLYGWTPDLDECPEAVMTIRSGVLPPGYPDSWPTAERGILPQGTARYDKRVQDAVARRKAKIAELLSNKALIHYPRDEVRKVLSFWNVDILH